MRDYSAKLGRWTSRDPIGEQGGYNLYVFSLNAPVLFADPYGLEPQDADSLSDFAERMGIAACTVIWQTADTFNRAVFFPLVDLLSLPDTVLKCVFGLSDDDLIAISAQFPGGYDDLMIGVVVGGGKTPKIVRKLVGYGEDASKKLPIKVQKQIENAKLPQTGETPFNPQMTKNRKGQAIIEKKPAQHAPGDRSKKPGYVDSEGRIWLKDDAHAGYPEHWDVQIDGGKDYFRVGMDGNPVTKSGN